MSHIYLKPPKNFDQNATKHIHPCGTIAQNKQQRTIDLQPVQGL
jgi:hypothetical protein